MLIFVLRRLLSTLVTLFLLMTLTFFLVRLAPGGPFDTNQVWPPEIRANIARNFELDLPLWTQWTHWIRDSVCGDFKESFQYSGYSVREMIANALPISAGLGLLSLFISILFGIILGCISAEKTGTFWDRVIVLIAVSGISLPSYLVASLLILIFSLFLGWFPPAWVEGPFSWILPTLTLSWRPLGIIIRLTRSSLNEVLKADYIRTAYGKGVPQSRVILKHALRNSLIPVLSLGGPLTANLITGSFLVEMVFQIPGLGKHFVQAVLNRDYPLVMGVTLVYGLILMGANLAVDLLYAWVDPRIRLGGTA